MLHMQIITLSCSHTRQLHWQPEHDVYWCLQCADMRQVLDSESTMPEDDTNASNPDWQEESVSWIREPTPAERKELERAQRLITERQ